MEGRLKVVVEGEEVREEGNKMGRKGKVERNCVEGEAS